jgi:hypothetical protein
MVVVGVYGGGYVEGTCTHTATLSSTSHVNEAKRYLESKLAFFSSDLSGVYEKSASESEMLQTSSNVSVASLKWNGGDSIYHKRSIDNIKPEGWKEWEKSLRFHPCALSTELDLLPISEIAKAVDENRARALQQAEIALFGCSLEYKPPQTRE